VDFDMTVEERKKLGLVGIVWDEDFGVVDLAADAITLPLRKRRITL